VTVNIIVFTRRRILMTKCRVLDPHDSKVTW